MGRPRRYRWRSVLQPPEYLTVPQAPLGALVWRLPAGAVSVSSAPVGGGWSRPRWILNVQVERGYARTDVEANIAEVAGAADLTGPGVGLLTAARVGRYGTGEERGLRVDVTAGVSHPTWAAAPDEHLAATAPGTVNIVARLPVALDPAAAVNAVATITEAKTQAFIERGVPGTGTATDAVTVAWTAGAGPPVRFCGPRAPWGAALARATRDAVVAAMDRPEAVGR